MEEKIFTNFNDFHEFLCNTGRIADDITFIEPKGAVVSKIGGNGAYEGEIYEAPITAPDLPENLVDTFDFEKPFEIHTDEVGNILEFVYNIDKETNERVSVRGKQGQRIFYQYMGAYRALSNGNEVKRADITNLGESGNGRK